MSDWRGWTTTVIQTAPRLLEVLRRLRPTIHVESIASIDDAFLVRHAVSAIIWDVDGTLTPDKGESVPSDVRAVLDAMDPRLTHAVLSNCDDDRLVQLGTLFADMSVLKGYRLENDQIVLRRLHRGQDQWSVRVDDGWQTISRPTGRVRSIRKPSGELIDLAVGWLGADRGRVLMVGDQYFTDIAGANMAGIRSIKVATLASASFPLAVQMFQRVEKVLYRILYGRPHTI